MLKLKEQATITRQNLFFHGARGTLLLPYLPAQISGGGAQRQANSKETSCDDLGGDGRHKHLQQPLGFFHWHCHRKMCK